MFDPRDFYKLSKSLFETTECGEALIRTAINRAYYSVYLTYREWLRLKFGVDINKEAEKRKRSVHTPLIDVVYEKTRKHFFLDLMRELKRTRETCDYDLKMEVTEYDAKTAIAIAEELLREVEVNL